MCRILKVKMANIIKQLVKKTHCIPKGSENRATIPLHFNEVWIWPLPGLWQGEKWRVNKNEKWATRYVTSGCDLPVNKPSVWLGH